MNTLVMLLALAAPVISLDEKQEGVAGTKTTKIVVDESGEWTYESNLGSRTISKKGTLTKEKVKQIVDDLTDELKDIPDSQEADAIINRYEVELKVGKRVITMKGHPRGSMDLLKVIRRFKSEYTSPLFP